MTACNRRQSFLLSVFFYILANTKAAQFGVLPNWAARILHIKLKRPYLLHCSTLYANHAQKAPLKSKSTSRTWEERPGVKNCTYSSATAVNKQNNKM